MNSPLDVQAHLKSEIEASDPWRLESNPFEHRRYAIMLDMIRAHGPVERGLEIGCAAGVFTELLAARCRSLHVVDVMPEAIGRMLQRTQDHHNVTCEVASVTENFAGGESFDLIVIAEVLCYLPDPATLRTTIEKLAARLRPGGLLVFGSAVDETCARWGLACGGAETAMREWEKYLKEASRISSTGSYWGENCHIVSYMRSPEAGEAMDPVHAQENDLIPFKAVREISAVSALVLAPHSDDEVLGCGGAIVRHVEAGTPVRVVIATGGAADSLVRSAESRAAAALLGYGEPIFWDYSDRGLRCGEELVRRIMSVMDDVDLVYAPSPDEIHPDHRALGLAALEAVRRKGGTTRLALYEVSTASTPNLLLDISSVLARKQAAIACFKSQLDKRNYDRYAAALNEFRTYTLPADVRAAEGYHLVSADELARDPLKVHRAGLDRRLAETVLQLRSAENRIEQLESTMRERLERARIDLATARHAVEAMRNSSSWKLTAPLRALTLWLRKLAGKPHSGA